MSSVSPETCRQSSEGGRTSRDTAACRTGWWTFIFHRGVCLDWFDLICMDLEHRVQMWSGTNFIHSPLKLGAARVILWAFAKIPGRVLIIVLITNGAESGLLEVIVSILKVNIFSSVVERRATCTRPRFHFQMLAKVLPNIRMCSWKNVIAKWRLYECLYNFMQICSFRAHPLERSPPTHTTNIYYCSTQVSSSTGWRFLLFAIQLFKNFTGITWARCLQN